MKQQDEEIVSNHEFTVSLLPKAGAIVAEVPRITASKLKEFGSDKVALWDDGNDFPQKVIEDVRKDPEIGTLLNKEATILYSGGLVWGHVKLVEGGKEILEPLKEPEHNKIRDWMRRSAIKRYLIEAATDFYWFRNFFPEMVLSRDRKQVVQLCVQAAELCRWERMDERGMVNNCYLNANWPHGKVTDKETKKIRVLDPYFDAAATLKMMKELNVIYPVSYPSPGSNYYQVADWNSIRKSGWLAVSQLIPEMKKAILEKQMTIKYLVEISDQFWDLKYPNFKSYDIAKKKKIKAEELKAFSDLLTGAEKAGQSMSVPFITKFDVGKEFAMWKITPIEDKMKDGKYLEEGKDASLYKSMAVGLHPALVGSVPNSGMGGAGSNIREAYNLHMLMVKSHQDLILEPLEVIRDYNGWDPNVEFRFRNSFMNTLDKGAETSQTAA